MVLKIFLILTFFNYIKLQTINIGNMSIDDFINKVNEITFKENEYKTIIESISNLIDKYYVYSEIAKNPPVIKGVDLIKELNEIDIKNIKYLDFFNKVQKIIYKTKDAHFSVIFLNITKYQYFIPFQFDVKTEGGKNYLYVKLMDKFSKYYYLFDKNKLDIIKKNQKLKIKKINNIEPIDYFLKNHFTLLKDEHAQFSSDLDEISYGQIRQPFDRNKFKDFTIEFENEEKVILDYQILYPIKTQKNFLNFYEKELLKQFHNNIYSKNSIIDIENLYLKEKGINLNRNLFNQEQISWKNLNDKIKYRIDHKNNVSVILQKSFALEERQTESFLIEMNNELAKNSYPIIIIESMNDGGYVHYSLVLERILNFYSGNRDVIVSFKINERNQDEISKQRVTNIETCGIEKVFSNKKYHIENFGGIKHNRTSFYRLFNTYFMVDFFYSGEKHVNRNPTDIIVFTDGFSYSATSLFIKDLQESGNAIIVGYNGIPNEERKKEKFNGSQSPTTVESLFQSFPKDKDVKTLLKYNIIMSTSFAATFNYTYQNDSVLHIPREYTINPIDERSNIYGRYDDSKYNQFIEEAKRIFKKYKTECNKDNKRLLLKNDSCKFNEQFLKGGNVCGDDGKWNLNKCEPYYCIEGYLFDPYNKKCNKDVCKSKFTQYIVFAILILIFVIVVIIISIILCCRYCKCCAKCCPCCRCCHKNSIKNDEITDIEAPLIN